MKKIFSLVLACIMVMSFAVVTSANTTYGTFTIPTLTMENLVAADSLNPNGHFVLDIKLKDLKSYDGTFLGYTGFQFDIEYDETKLLPGKMVSGRGGAVEKYGETTCGIKDFDMEGNVVGTATVTVSNPVVDGKKVIRIVSSKAPTVDYEGDGSEVVAATIYLRPASAEVKGDAAVTLGYTEFAYEDATTAYAHKDFASVAGNINLGSTPIEPDPEPVVTTVKTFAKRLYLDNTLYTVGVVTEGDDYVAADVKAGINIVKGEGTVNYWTKEAPVSDDNGTSYFVVALTDITEDTEITADSASKALLVVGDETLEGAAVSANSTSVDDVVVE